MHKRQEKILKDVDVYFDVMEKFAKEESKAFLAKKEGNCSEYVYKITRYAQDNRHRKIGLNHKPNARYLAYAERVIAKCMG